MVLLLWTAVSAADKEASEGQKLRDIVDCHIAAHGGMETWQAVEALEVRGQFTNFSVADEFYILKMSDGRFFSDHHLGKHRVQEGYDGAVSWTIDPWHGFTFARKANKVEQHVFAQKAEFFSPFFMWEERGFVAAYTGTEDPDGTEVHVLSLTRPGMPEEIWHIDTQTCLAYKSVTPWVDFTFRVNSETFYDDYREVEGLMLPFMLEQTYSTRHTFTEIYEYVINPQVEEEVFAMPSCEEMQQVAAIEGHWEVQVELMNRAGNWQALEPIAVSFAQVHPDVFSGFVSYDMSFPANIRFTLNYNHRTQKYQMVVYNEFYSVTDLFEGEWEDDALVLDDIALKNSSDAVDSDVRQVFTRYVLSLSDENNFLLERKRTDNRGESWAEAERMSFARKLP